MCIFDSNSSVYGLTTNTLKLSVFTYPVCGVLGHIIKGLDYLDIYWGGGGGGGGIPGPPRYETLPICTYVRMYVCTKAPEDYVTMYGTHDCFRCRFQWALVKLTPSLPTPVPPVVTPAPLSA